MYIYMCILIHKYWYLRETGLVCNRHAAWQLAHCVSPAVVCISNPLPVDIMACKVKKDGMAVASTAGVSVYKGNFQYFCDFRCRSGLRTADKKELWNSMSAEEKKVVNKERKDFNERQHFPSAGWESLGIIIYMKIILVWASSDSRHHWLPPKQQTFQQQVAGRGNYSSGGAWYLTAAARLSCLILESCVAATATNTHVCQACWTGVCQWGVYIHTCLETHKWTHI